MTYKYKCNKCSNTKTSQNKKNNWVCCNCGGKLILIAIEDFKTRVEVKADNVERDERGFKL